MFAGTSAMEIPWYGILDWLDSSCQLQVGLRSTWLPGAGKGLDRLRHKSKSPRRMEAEPALDSGRVDLREVSSLKK